jgi:hypothetical protein
MVLAADGKAVANSRIAAAKKDKKLRVDRLG